MIEQAALNSSYFACVPDYVLNDATLKPGDAELFAQIQLCSIGKGYCWISNAYLARKTRESIRNIQKRIARLKKAGYLTVTVYKDKFISKRYIYINEITENKKISMKRTEVYNRDGPSAIQKETNNTKEIKEQQQEAPPPEPSAPAAVAAASSEKPPTQQASPQKPVMKTSPQPKIIYLSKNQLQKQKAKANGKKILEEKKPMPQKEVMEEKKAPVQDIERKMIALNQAPLTQEFKELICTQYEALQIEKCIKAYLPRAHTIRNPGGWIRSVLMGKFKLPPDPDDSFDKNKNFAKKIEDTGVIPPGIIVYALRDRIEFTFGPHMDVIGYEDMQFEEKVKQCCKKWNIKRPKEYEKNQRIS